MLLEGLADAPLMMAILQSEGFDGSSGTVVRIAGDAECACSLNASFDLILAIAVVEYVADISTLLTRLTQRLDPDGTILMTVPNRRSPVRVAQRMVRPFAPKTTTPSQPTDQLLAGLRPHNDNVPWLPAANDAGLTVQEMTKVPLGLSRVRGWFHPTLLIALKRSTDHRG